MEMKNWSSKVKRVINEEGRGRNSINLAMVSANNHYIHTADDSTS